MLPVCVNDPAKLMATKYLIRLLELLPLHAEEDDLREVVSIAELLDHMAPDGHGRTEAEAVLATVRRIFDALRLLDLRPAMRDKWAFVSFPAFLTGHSLMRTLASENQSLCPEDYWRDAGDTAPDRVEEQRQLLRALESGRVRFCPDGYAKPIRFVYVAWGFIRFGRHFLLVHREDKTREGTANYVLPGGRFRIDDLPMHMQTAETLRLIHCASSSVALGALARTLERELGEELGILSGEHYVASKRLVVGPYRKVEGARNRHAYTEYQLVLHDLRLTTAGEARVLERAASDTDRLTWFSVEEILAPAGRIDGKQAFVDALREQLGDELRAFLDDTPDSGGTPYVLSGDTRAVDLPASQDQPFRVGRTGDEKEVSIPLSGDEWALLWTAMAHARGLSLAALDGHLVFLGGGWIKLRTTTVGHVAENLIRRLSEAGLPLIRRAGDFVRSAIAPEILYFAENSFQYSLAEAGQGGDLEVSLVTNPAPWAELAPTNLHIPLNRNMTRALFAVAEDKDPVGYSEEAMKKGVKEMLDSKTRPFGLRKLVRMANNCYRITVPQAE